MSIPTAHAAPVDIATERVRTWDAAAARLGVAGSLWEPTRTGGLDSTGSIVVRAGGLRIVDGAVASGRTFAQTRYGSASRGFRIVEKWADTRWPRPPVRSRTLGRVGPDTVVLGPVGATVEVRVMVYANCQTRPFPLTPERIPFDERCNREDVLRFGGLLTMTARPSSDRPAPGATTVLIESTGLAYRDLLTVAGSLEQVAGMPAGGAGSAQMVGMCRQMVVEGMSAAAADGFARQSGYLTRVGIIDGEPQAVTADYRPDRFTLQTRQGRVVSCTYG
jgi:hypothetical protein